MGQFRSQSACDRNRVIDAAARARVERKRGRRAIQPCGRIPAVEPPQGETRARLAPLLARAGPRREARLPLDGLAQRSSWERLRRGRGAPLRLSTGPSTAWRRVQAVFQGPPEAARPAGVVPSGEPAAHPR